LTVTLTLHDRQRIATDLWFDGKATAEFITLMKHFEQTMVRDDFVEPMGRIYQHETSIHKADGTVVSIMLNVQMPGWEEEAEYWAKALGEPEDGDDE
jgi:hypothetical protein